MANSVFTSSYLCDFPLRDFINFQVVGKLHGILRPFLLRRMKADVELTLPLKKEIILYTTMTEHQKNFQNHLVNRTLEGHLTEKLQSGTYFYFVLHLHGGHCYFVHKMYAYLLHDLLCYHAGCGMKGKLNNLMVQLRKNCNHPDLLQSAFDGSCKS